MVSEPSPPLSPEARGGDAADLAEVADMPESYAFWRSVESQYTSCMYGWDIDWSAVGAVATFLAAIAAAISARAALNLNRENHNSRHPLLVLDIDGGPLEIELDAKQGFTFGTYTPEGELIAGSIPELEVTNFGGSSALNVRMKLELEVPEGRLQIPPRFGEMHTGERVVHLKLQHGDIILDHLDGRLLVTPVTSQAAVEIGVIGADRTRRVRVPPALLYALGPVALHYAIVDTEGLGRAWLLETHPVQLRIEGIFDTASRRQLSQTFEITLEIQDRGGHLWRKSGETWHRDVAQRPWRFSCKMRVTQTNLSRPERKQFFRRKSKT